MGIFGPIGDLISIIPNAFKTVDNITNAIANERIALISAKTNEEKIHAQERIDTLSQRRQVLIAEAGVSRLNIIMRSTMAFSVTVVLAKLLIWDKVIGSLAGCSGAPAGTCGIFTTDPFDDNQWRIILAVVSFYFITEITAAVVRSRR